MSKFEIIKNEELNKYIDLFQKEDIVLPQRQTLKSCGYDFYLPYDIVIKAKQNAKIFTGVKASMMDDEFLMLVIRSSKAIKEGIILTNQVGIIDSDYYNNPDNDGHIIICVTNTNDKDVLIRKSDRIAQGIILKYNTISSEKISSNERKGGFGSTNK